MVEIEKLQQDTMSMSVLCIDNILKFGPVISNSSEQHVLNTNVYKSKAAHFFGNDLRYLLQMFKTRYIDFTTQYIAFITRYIGFKSQYIEF